MFISPTGFCHGRRKSAATIQEEYAVTVVTLACHRMCTIPAIHIVCLRGNRWIAMPDEKTKEISERVAKTHRILPLRLYMSFATRKPYNEWIFRGKWPATWGMLFDWCSFYYFVRNSLVALLTVLCARTYIVLRHPVRLHSRWIYCIHFQFNALSQRYVSCVYTAIDE